MENEKKLNSAESIAIIERMIAATRSKYEKGGGSIFLIWGYISFLITGIVALSKYMFPADYWYNWIWWLIPVLGYPIMYLTIRKRPKPVKSYIDNFISNVWLVVGLSVILFTIAATIAQSYTIIVPVVSLALSMGMTITGLTIKFRPLIFGSIISIVISLAMLIVGNLFWLFMGIFLTAMIIPGHILNYRGRCSKN